MIDMNSVQDNIFLKKEAFKKIEAHCMCAEIQESKDYLIIIYPYGDWPVNGVRVENTAKGIEQALVVMERHWQESFI
jgi:hypothetical protein